MAQKSVLGLPRRLPWLQRARAVSGRRPDELDGVGLERLSRAFGFLSLSAALCFGIEMNFGHSNPSRMVNGTWTIVEPFHVSAGGNILLALRCILEAGILVCELLMLRWGRLDHQLLWRVLKGARWVFVQQFLELLVGVSRQAYAARYSPVGYCAAWYLVNTVFVTQAWVFLVATDAMQVRLPRIRQCLFLGMWVTYVIAFLNNLFTTIGDFDCDVFHRGCGRDTEGKTAIT